MMILFAVVALLSSAFAQNRMYQFGTGPDIITVFGDEDADQYRGVLMYHQCAMLSKLTDHVRAQTHIADLSHLLAPIPFYDLEALAHDFYGSECDVGRSLL
eukprot:Lankesteria_metandrocarpae@DN5187_c0_g2_i4.p3